MNILIFGSNGLVGKSLNKILNQVDEYNIISSTRKDTNLFNFKETNEKISEVRPDVIINVQQKLVEFTPMIQKELSFWLKT